MGGFRVQLSIPLCYTTSPTEDLKILELLLLYLFPTMHVGVQMESKAELARGGKIWGKKLYKIQTLGEAKKDQQDQKVVNIKLLTCGNDLRRYTASIANLKTSTKRGLRETQTIHTQLNGDEVVNGRKD